MSDYTIEFYEDRHGFCPIADHELAQARREFKDWQVRSALQ